MFAGISLQALVGSIIFILYCITVSGLILVIITENRNPLKTIPWVVVLMMLPGIGLLFYFFFGQDNRKQRVISRRAYKRIMKIPQESRRSQYDGPAPPDCYGPLVSLLGHSHHSPLMYSADIEIYTDGEDKFRALYEALEAARHHIHLQYYIFLDDETGCRVRDILIAKARAGVEVRVLYDDVGCWKVSKRFFRGMQEAGVEVHAFLKVAFPVLTSKVNYRNHRKIVVVDGHTGFMGGMNVADRYVKGNRLGKWRDTHFRITGKGVYGLQSAFLVDWYVASRRLLKDSAYYPPMGAAGGNLMQILSSGPVGQWRTLLQAIIFAVANAKKYIYIQTPYFLPTEGLNQALQTAALGGVDVRLMLPKRSDSKAANMASHSFTDDMVKAGAKIFLYEGGFLHSKLVVSDDMLTGIGSANMDFRSFEHNFEITAFVYNADFARRMRKIFLHDIQRCEKLVSTQWLKRPRLRRMAESFMRLFSPLL
ncbi:MAG: cardiolipin synthase [Tannerellaceae bacterium]|jgi:cardiolipin synthase|nr:cardiolipin synthase [Tannerellaceae bacterium]